MSKFRMRWLWVCLIGLAACTTPNPSVPMSTPVPPSASLPTASPKTKTVVTVGLLYPRTDTEVEMGQSVKFIVRVTDGQDQPVRDGQVAITLLDPGGKPITDIPAAFGSGDVYRSAAWTVPHRALAGAWSISISVRTNDAQGSGTGSFQVAPSTSEILLNKYGFWIEAPTLRGIVPQLVAEKGDAQRGLIRWGGQIPAIHILPENWIEIHWLEGQYQLDSPAAVRHFMLAQVGELGFTPVRALGPFEPTRFKRWAAWQVEARGRRALDQTQFMVFYTPEVDKTFVIGTTVVLPPGGIDPHAALRDSFEIDPAIRADGVAPEPLPKLLPAPELISPGLGESFRGTAQPIVLRWQAVQALATDEYYAVLVEYDYGEATSSVTFTSRQTQFSLPESLYRMPNCGVFNWQVRLMRQTGMDPTGQPAGTPIGYNSLYWYVQWLYPPGESAPFLPKCPNPQF
jgi:hypothetical protein